MEGRIRSLLLGCFYISLALASNIAHAADLEVEQVSKPVIDPNIERMVFDEAKINPDNFEVIASFGMLSIEDFSTSAVISAKLTYRVSESFFTGVEFGTASAGKSSVEILLPGTTILSDAERDYNYYLISLGYDLFPSEAFVTDGTTLNTALYVVAAAGNTQFAGSDNFTFSWGAGYRITFNNYLTAYFDVRDHVLDLDLFGESKLTNNIEISLGVGYYF